MLPDLCRLCVVESMMNKKQRDETIRLQDKRITELQARLERVSKLPEKWRDEENSTPIDNPARSIHGVAYELEQAMESE